MAKTTLFSGSPDRRKVTLFHEEDGLTHFETKQDVEPIIDLAHAMAEVKPDKEFRHVAFIPDVVFDQSCRENWGPKDWKRWANNPVNACFRTWPGKI